MIILSLEISDVIEDSLKCIAGHRDAAESASLDILDELHGLSIHEYVSARRSNCLATYVVESLRLGR